MTGIFEYEVGAHTQLYLVGTGYMGSRDSEFGSLLKVLFVRWGRVHVLTRFAILLIDAEVRSALCLHIPRQGGRGFLGESGH